MIAKNIDITNLCEPLIDFLQSPENELIQIRVLVKFNKTNARAVSEACVNKLPNQITVLIVVNSDYGRHDLNYSNWTRYQNIEPIVRAPAS